MKYKLVSEEQILDEQFRAKVIAEITGQENVGRKKSDKRRYEIYKDMTKKWVIESLKQEENLLPSTLQSMAQRASNISILRKVINKLAKCYVNGVDRIPEVEADKTTIDLFQEELNFNSAMARSDKYVELFKNCMAFVKPEKNTRESTVAGKPVFDITATILAPYQYDVIEDMYEPEKPRVVILSDFVDSSSMMGVITNSITQDGRTSRGALPSVSSGDGKDQIIADSPADSGAGCQTYIWWSDRYHFTTDGKGKIIAQPEEGPINPVQTLPFVNLAADQDGEFWALGGDDLVDGAVLVNKLVTDMYSIAYMQGWGQMVITGKNIPKVLAGGPHNALVFEQVSKDDPMPTVSFASANAPLDVWMSMIEQYVALLLSTNNLSPRNVAGKLESSDFPSGIAMLIEQSESTGNIQERQKLFVDQEPMVWELIKRWHDLYASIKALSPKFQAIPQLKSSAIKLVFHSPAPVVTEAEKMDVLAKRKELGINTMVELIKIDQPELSEEEAEQKLLKIRQQQLEKVSSVMTRMVNGGIPNGQEASQETKTEEEVVSSVEPSDEMAE